MGPREELGGGVCEGKVVGARLDPIYQMKDLISPVLGLMDYRS